MLPTFVIGLREGVEAALIVGIIAAFLRQEGRRDALRWMWAGVAIAAAICVAAGVTLELVSRDLPQRQQEMLETVVGAIAVAAVTFMIVWMRRNARGLRRALEGRASDALAEGSVIALVAMAFFAVIREGFETSVFLLAAFDSSSDPLAAGGGALLGVVARRRDRLRDLPRRHPAQPGPVLPGHRDRPGAGRGRASSRPPCTPRTRPAGSTACRAQTVDLRWLVAPGTVRSSLLTGLLGFQPRPVTAEAIGYLVYAIPVAIYVLWPSGLRLRRHRAAQPLPAGRTA